MTSLRILTAAGLTTVLLAGCGGSSAPAGGSAATPSKHSIASPQSPAPKSLLAQIVLQASELPGWTATPYQDDPSTDQDQLALLRCAGGRDTSSDKVADVNSSDFSLDQATVSSDATSYRSQSDVDNDAALLRSPKFASCFQTQVKQQLGKDLPAGTAIKSAKVTITPGAGGGPANVAATAAGVITVTTNGLTLAVYLNVAFITGPMIEAEVDAENVGSPVPATLRAKLVQAVAARAARG
ncbi:MAG TPA: hypothetical protein VFD94_07015 [Jatrophihabitans sp.]|nr:hypothetical protein [Jatrophihabitans sp.]